MPLPVIAISNASTCLTDAQVEAVLPALQKQVSDDFKAYWELDCTLTFLNNGQPLTRGWWQVVITDNPDQAGALGYHEMTSAGTPLGKVFAKLDIESDSSWTTTLSHELLEMLADPNINLSVMVQTAETRGTLYAYEVCDACEDVSFGYLIEHVLVSDFVYPSWFESFRKPHSTVFDYQKHITKSFDLLKGGYIGYFDVTGGSGWQQQTKDQRLDYRARPRVGSRRERRRTPRDQWQLSDVVPVARRSGAMAGMRG